MVAGDVASSSSRRPIDKLRRTSIRCYKPDAVTGDATRAILLAIDAKCKSD